MYKCSIDQGLIAVTRGGEGEAVETAFTSFYTGPDALAVKTLRRGRGKRKRTKWFGEVIVS